MAKENENQIAVKKRLIYAEDLFEPVDFTVVQVGGRSGGKTMAMYEQLFRKRVEMAPTVDAVEVVRCGECLYFAETRGKDSGKPCGYGICTKPFHISNIVTIEDFCSFGKRRTDNGK